MLFLGFICVQLSSIRKSLITPQIADVRADVLDEEEVVEHPFVQEHRQRIAELREELALQQPRTSSDLEEAIPLHPLIYNIPTDLKIPYGEAQGDPIEYAD